MNLQASGTFEVKVTPLSGSGFARLALAKQYAGSLTGTAEGEMIASNGGGEPSGGYVALERVTGALNGRSGSFVLQHSGVMAPGMLRIDIQVSPGSGAGELAGITGRMSIRMENKKHYYEFEYTLPE